MGDPDMVQWFDMQLLDGVAVRCKTDRTAPGGGYLWHMVGHVNGVQQAGYHMCHAVGLGSAPVSVWWVAQQLPDSVELLKRSAILVFTIASKW